MGTDIHGVFQRRTKTGWEDVTTEFEFNRHYQLFAVLADVRNGYGFAGIPTGEAVTPIAEQRGYPVDFVRGGADNHPIAALEFMAKWYQKYHLQDEPMEVWMGDHSHTWLSGEEMLNWYANSPTVIKIGVIDRALYATWDKKSRPESYCGGVSGHNVVTIEDDEVFKTSTPGWTHIRVEWKSKLSEELGYFFDEVKRLAELHGEIRFVMGFDS